LVWSYFLDPYRHTRPCFYIASDIIILSLKKEFKKFNFEYIDSNTKLDKNDVTDKFSSSRFIFYIISKRDELVRLDILRKNYVLGNSESVDLNLIDLIEIGESRCNDDYYEMNLNEAFQRKLIIISLNDMLSDYRTNYIQFFTLPSQLKQLLKSIESSYLL
jgi:hypothetical protein